MFPPWQQVPAWIAFVSSTRFLVSVFPARSAVASTSITIRTLAILAVILVFLKYNECLFTIHAHCMIQAKTLEGNSTVTRGKCQLKSTTFGAGGFWTLGIDFCGQDDWPLLQPKLQAVPVEYFWLFALDGTAF
jgi:hypothetical protein